MQLVVPEHWCNSLLMIVCLSDFHHLVVCTKPPLLIHCIWLGLAWSGVLTWMLPGKL